MRIFLSNLTAAALLLHVLLGCCWHHGDECAEHSHVAACESHVAECCHGHHGHSEHDHDAPAPPDKCKLKCEGTCTYLPPQKVVIAAPHLLHSTDFVASALSVATRYSAWVTSIWEQSYDPRARAPSVRLHLLYQTILV